MDTIKALQERTGRIGRDTGASISACPLLELGVCCWERPRAIASFLSIVGQHHLFLAGIMQRGPLSNKLCRPFKEISASHRSASSFAEFLARALVQTVAVAGGRLHGLGGARERRELAEF